MKNNWKLFFGIALIGLTTACETELKVNADYSRTAVIYGILNKNESKHIIKIGKTFQGTGNALDFAKVADSSRIQGLQPIVQTWRNGVLKKSYTLRDTIISGKQQGTFFSGDQFAYTFDEPALDELDEVKILFTLDGKEVSASTQLVAKTTITSPTSNFNVNLVEKDYEQTPTTNLKDLTVAIGSALHAVEAEMFVTFHYTEVYNDNTSAEKTIELGIGKTTTGRLTYKPISFFNQIAYSVKPDPNVKKRIIGNFDINVINYNIDLKAYMDVNNPVSGILTEQPEFTNVNNGIGLFASKIDVMHSKPFNKFTDIYLALAPMFADLKFCSINPDLIGRSNIQCK